jgi:hypothetical protein
MKIKSIIPELKINLIHSDNLITNNNYNLIQGLIDECVSKYSIICPNFLITYLNIYSIDENNYRIDENSLEFTYLKKNVSFLQLNYDEKIYISKEKIKIIKLKDFFKELKLRPCNENESNISIIGETYRELRDNFNKKSVQKNQCKRYNNNSYF